MEKTKRYCEPWNTGLSSTDRAVAARLSRLMTALDVEITSHVVRGTISDELREFRYQLLCKLERDGWSLSYDGGSRMKVRIPSSKKPYPRRTMHPQNTPEG